MLLSDVSERQFTLYKSSQEVLTQIFAFATDYVHINTLMNCYFFTIDQ